LGDTFVKPLNAADLAENERRSVEEAARLIKAELPVTRVILFGSRARGAARPDSDIDLLVLTSEPVTRELRRELHGRLFDVSLRNDVLLSSIVVSEREWSEGLIRYMLIHSEVERDGCEV